MSPTPDLLYTTSILESFLAGQRRADPDAIKTALQRTAGQTLDEQAEADRVALRAAEQRRAYDYAPLSRDVRALNVLGDTTTRRLDPLTVDEGHR
ncbi:hypothetical protein [Gordonia sputi]